MTDVMLTLSSDRNSAPNCPIRPDPPPKCPYPGLRPFKMNEAGIFYGRNSQKDEILARLLKSRMVFVLGSSGCGKSSLIKAGVIPALRAGLLTKEGHYWQVVTMRPGRRPVESLARAFSKTLENLRAASGRSDIAARTSTADKMKPSESSGMKADGGPQAFLSCFEDDDEGLWSATSLLPDVLREGSEKNTARYLLLVDQFEEIFGSQIETAAEVDHFVKILSAQYARPHPALFVVFTMRSDYLGNCSKFPTLSEAANNCSYLTPILAPSELREAIERPAQDYSASVEKSLVDDILAEMHAGMNYDPDSLPLMQHALLWLWHRATDAVPKLHSDRKWPILLTAKDYHDFGGMKGILKAHADDLLTVAEGDNGERQLIVETLFRRLAEQDDQGRIRRCPATFEEIRQIAACQDDELERVVAPFAEKKLPSSTSVPRSPPAKGFWTSATRRSSARGTEQGDGLSRKAGRRKSFADISTRLPNGRTLARIENRSKDSPASMNSSAGGEAQSPAALGIVDISRATPTRDRTMIPPPTPSRMLRAIASPALTPTSFASGGCELSKRVWSVWSSVFLYTSSTSRMRTRCAHTPRRSRIERNTHSAMKDPPRLC
jgi:hypothetical protein